MFLPNTKKPEEKSEEKPEEKFKEKSEGKPKENNIEFLLDDGEDEKEIEHHIERYTAKSPSKSKEEFKYNGTSSAIKNMLSVPSYTSRKHDVSSLLNITSSDEEDKFTMNDLYKPKYPDYRDFGVDSADDFDHFMDENIMHPGEWKPLHNKHGYSDTEESDTSEKLEAIETAVEINGHNIAQIKSLINDVKQCIYKDSTKISQMMRYIAALNKKIIFLAEALIEKSTSAPEA